MDPAGRSNGELKGDKPFIYNSDPQQVGKPIPRGQAATSSRRATRKTKVRPSFSSSTSLPRDPLGVRASPAKAVCSSFPEGNGDLNHEWCVYALKFWENATMTGACLVGIAWRAVYMETREVVIGAAMMSSPGPRANIGHVCNHHWDLPRRETIGVCVRTAAAAMLPHVSLDGNVVFINIDPTYMH
uniref:Uncharacterized protein n=1 Tax=Bionectria ochroleuca TaxID=29856 RepID=A0A8H7TP42_BIOOC